MPSKGKLGDKDVQFLLDEDLEQFNKRLDHFGSALNKRMDDFGTVLTELKDSLKKGAGSVEVAKTSPNTSEQEYCPECESYTKDLYEHLKKNPEKHGLVKEVPKKRSVKEMLSEHDFLTCPNCRKDVDEHLSKKGLQIVAIEEASEGVDFEL